MNLPALHLEAPFTAFFFFGFSHIFFRTIHLDPQLRGTFRSFKKARKIVHRRGPAMAMADVETANGLERSRIANHPLRHSRGLFGMDQHL